MMYEKHVMPNVSLACNDLIGHIENLAYNKREHALKTTIKISEQRWLRQKKNETKPKKNKLCGCHSFTLVYVRTE